MKLEFSAGGIIYQKKDNNISFALILDSYDKWTFPKGHIEKGEKPDVAASREVGEEIGIKDLSVKKLLGKTDYWFKMDGELYHKYVYYFLMEASPDSILKHQVSEIKDACWFAPEKAQDILGYKKDSAEILKKAFEELKILV